MPNTPATIGIVLAALGLLGAFVAFGTRILEFLTKWREKPTLAPLISILATKPRILICDDDASLLEAMRQSLNGGYDVSSYRNEFDAISEIAREHGRKRSFDLVIVDLVMAQVEGTRFVASIREMEFGLTRKTPIVILTGMGRMIDKPNGVKAVWRKPQDVLNLSLKVRAILDAAHPPTD